MRQRIAVKFQHGVDDGAVMGVDDMCAEIAVTGEVYLYHAVFRHGADIIAGFPTGSGTPAMDQAVTRVAAKGIPVVMTNRGGMGRVTDTRASEARPLIWGDNLTPQKARILLMLALTTTRDPAELQGVFQKY